jgi:poly [ADP-ribose] polymerase
MTMTSTSTAPKVISTTMYVAVDPKGNHNKFYKVEIFDSPVTEPGRLGKMETGHIRTSWGRVGAPKIESQLLNDDKILQRKIREKTNRKDCPYTEVKTVGTPDVVNTGVRATSEQVKKAAVQEIAHGCPITAALVKRLAETNKHELVAATGGLSKGGMDIDLETGMVCTALGVVTLEAVKEARQILDRMLPYINRNDTDNSKYTDVLGTYLRLVPQDVMSRRKGWHTDFINVTSQTQLLDQLETSVELAEQRIADAARALVKGGDKPQSMFECQLNLVEDEKVWKRIKDAFYETRNYGHTSAGLKPIRIYEVAIPHMVSAFDKHGRKVGNIKELWHGTRVFNILSILKRGFVLPTQLSTAQTTGAMYGPGLYFSSQSTKSLNYSQGYWDGGHRDNNCYMFRVNVAMGREYIPSYSGDARRPGYDSCHAVAGRSGVRNDEQIVFNSAQTNPRYLVEFNK